MKKENVLCIRNMRKAAGKTMTSYRDEMRITELFH